MAWKGIINSTEAKSGRVDAETLLRETKEELRAEMNRRLLMEASVAERVLFVEKLEIVTVDLEEKRRERQKRPRDERKGLFWRLRKISRDCAWRS